MQQLNLQFMQPRMQPKKLPLGIALLEALVALVVLAFGVLELL